MENLKHTKDWNTTECTNGGLIVCLGDTKDYSVQRVQIINKANAKLIAAAPELLEALIETLDLLTDNKDVLLGSRLDISINLAKNAIKKATE